MLACRYHNCASIRSFAGVLFSCTVGQAVMWGFFATLVTFWGVVFPFSYQFYKKAGHLKYFDVAMVIVGTILPCVPAFVNLRYGYLSKTSRPLACEGANRNVILYSYLLPGSVLTCVAASMLILVFWKLFKVGSCIQRLEHAL